jgi:hypothetical protein
MASISSADAVIVRSDNVSETMLFRLTKAEKDFIETQARRELRTQSNYLRSLVVEAMGSS